MVSLPTHKGVGNASKNNLTHRLACSVSYLCFLNLYLTNKNQIDIDGSVSLYPSKNIMKVSILSKSELFNLIEKKELTSKSAVVSFADDKDEFLDFPKNIDVLKVVFYDIRPSSTVKEHYDDLLPEAHEIAHFVHQKVLEGKDIICQCDYGISRSAGLAAAILQRYAHRGIDVFADYKYTPNQFVYNKVYQALMRLK